MKKTQLTALAPNGQIITRTTARTYTHVVIARRSFDLELEYCLGQAAFQAEVNHFYYTSGAWKKYNNAPEEVAQAEVYAAMTAEEFAQDYFNTMAPNYLEKDFSRWVEIGWAGRPDLAAKLAVKTSGFAELTIIPVNA